MAYFRKRGQMWYYTIEITGDGKRRRKEIPGGKTKAEAARAYAQAVMELERRPYLTPTKKTVDELFEEYLRDVVAVNARGNTLRAYSCLYHRHVSPAIGTMQIRMIRPKMLQNILVDMKEHGLARSTIGTVCAVLKRGFVYAADMCEYIDHSPAQNICIPKFVAVPKRVGTFSKEEIAAIFERYKPDHVLYLPITLSYHTGARLGECLALRWSDVDMFSREITIHQTLVKGLEAGKQIQPAPKTSSSYRTITYGDTLQKILKSAHARQAQTKLLYGKYYQDNDLICCYPDGSLVGLTAIRSFNKFVKQFGEGLTFHSLRHTHATMLLEAGEDLELVAKRLGHSSLEMTSRTYSHVLDQRKQRTRDLLDKIL
jgi:prophage lambdaba04, site-specific recombinase, phage integrase family